jgi:hypothetical protein
MKKLLAALLVGGALSAAGCATITSSGPSATSVTGEAWYTEAIGFFGITWGSRVWYCPAPTANAPSTCKEAKLIQLTKDELQAQQDQDKKVHQ